MKVGIIGSGGREHAICQSLKNSNKINKIFCFPGNAGTQQIAENVKIDLEKFENLKNFIFENKIELIIVGPEKPLVDGLVDYLEKFQIKVFGPNKFSSQLEGSKIFTKELCKKYKIPTAKFGVFEDNNKAKNFVNNSNFPIVVKADNLASGKGVYICEDTVSAKNAVNEIFKGKFGLANQVLIEENEMKTKLISDNREIRKKLIQEQKQQQELINTLRLKQNTLRTQIEKKQNIFSFISYKAKHLFIYFMYKDYQITKNKNRRRIICALPSNSYKRNKIIRNYY